MSDPREIASMRRAFRRSAAPPKPESCPAPATIWAALHGELSLSEVRRIVDHTADCAACAEDWRLALALEDEAGQQ
jgi:putative zinc finger protein